MAAFHADDIPVAAFIERSTGRNLYAPLVLETDYKAKESSHFLKKMYNNSIQNMIAALYDSREMKSSDVEELREFLDKLEEGQGQ